jgi:hypothetical protein
VDQHNSCSIQYERIERVIVEHTSDDETQSLSGGRNEVSIKAEREISREPQFWSALKRLRNFNGDPSHSDCSGIPAFGCGSKAQRRIRRSRIGQESFFGELMVEECLMIAGTLAVCVREVQKGLMQSSKRLIESKIQQLGVGGQFKILHDRIITHLRYAGRHCSIDQEP